MTGKHNMSSMLPPIVVILLSLIFAVTSYQYDPESRMMPRAVALLAILLSVIEMLSQGENRIGRTLRRVLSGKAAQPVPGLDGQSGVRHPVRQELAAFAWTLGFLGLTIVLGFYLSIPIYVFAYLRFHARKTVLTSSAVAFGLVGFLYLTFELLLGYSIFGGMFAGAII